MKFGKISIKVDYKKAGVTMENVQQPYMDAYLLNPAKVPYKRKAVIICPGGAYRENVAAEAEPVAVKLMEAGIQAFVLWYSVEPAVFPMALMELGQAVRIVREHAAEWDIDPDGIAVCGFSAGGHLAGSLSCLWNSGFLSDSLETTPDRIRPNAAILAYPVITSGMFAHRESFDCLLRGLSPEYMELTSLEKQVTKDTPPTFIWHTYEDTLVPVENSLYYMLSLREHQVPFEAHIFEKGEHGLSAADRECAGEPFEESIRPHVAAWVKLAVNWLKSL